MRRLFIAAMAAASVFSFSAQADVIKLKLSHFLPSSHPTQKDFLEPWAAELEKRTNGKVKVQIYPAGSAFGHVAKQFDQVRAGVVDIAHGLTGFPRGRLPRTLVTDLPFLVKSSDAASKTLWDLYPTYLAPEYKGMKMLAMHAHNAGLIHTKGKKVESIEDLKGLRLRTPSLAISNMLKHLGAMPVGLPPTQVYENLSKGVIDGNVFPYEAVNSFKLFEVLDHHLDAKAYTTSFYFAMNEKKYNSLPEDVRKVIDELSGQTLVNKFGPWWTKWDQPGIQAIKEKGNSVTVLSDEQRAAWRKELEPMIDAYLADMEKKGVSNAREIYAKAQELVAKYEK
ncbi:TRAP transporter substrate-binding protein [Terasakiella sp. A23]|uniref:TRAP transporter substrate-binding protein n=1 Tax=Terasakiella sp. FCG-A23 TaxID=3080561 RepID=UPI00295579D2|nr:TRAP transporter substrate-binding protein [Terasakiella sp. A23]MDV7340594.1 TRAP transporter substrate-binding protein [Terasakiella sp. A23]